MNFAEINRPEPLTSGDPYNSPLSRGLFIPHNQLVANRLILYKYNGYSSSSTSARMARWTIRRPAPLPDRITRRRGVSSWIGSPRKKPAIGTCSNYVGRGGFAARNA